MRPTDCLSDMATQILLVCLRRLRNNELLTTLPSRDLQLLMEEAWHEVFLLHAAYWPVDVMQLIRQTFSPNGTQVSYYVAQLSI